ncbi:MAG TPA: oxidoreductase [Alphaproteobacteria bacterium]|nr:oxidoreductase [Alphaproteobacteria bacterium]
MASSSENASVWLVTGCSSGIGRAIGAHALEQGCKVALTARNPETLADLAANYANRALALPLDVTDRVQVRAAIVETVRAFGRLDVLVNNAGYGYLAAIEEGEEEQIRAMFDTNYFGAVAMIQAALPEMRNQRRGHVINISSMTGLVANPGAGFYSSSKFALEALTEALSKEVAIFGIKVTAVEPGGFRTDWSGRSMRETSRPLEAYADTVGARRAMIRGMDGKQTGDPQRCAEEVFKIALSPNAPLHLLLGRDVYGAYRAKLADLQTQIAAWESVSLSTDYES